MSPDLLELLVNAFLQTLAMVAAAGAVGLVAGLPLAILLTLTNPDGLSPRPALHRSLGSISSSLRSAPFLILLIAVIPATRLLLGSAIGTIAAILPLSVAATAYFARATEVALRQVDRGLIDAGLAMGASRGQILRHILLPEAFSGILGGFAVTLVLLLAASVVAGTVGAGGLGDLAIHYGIKIFDPVVAVASVAAIVALVYLVQAAGTRLVRSLDHRA